MKRWAKDTEGSRGHCASTVGLNVEQIRTYVKWQNRKAKELEKQQLTML